MKKGVISILSTMFGTVIGAGTVGRIAGKSIKEARELSEKHLALFLMMDRWVEVKQKGKNIASYFEKNGYKEIAIYGMSYAGKRLLFELKGSGIIVKYGIDQKADEIYADIDILKVDDEPPSVDAIVVTPVFFFDEIEEKLSDFVSCPVISLEDVLYDV
ncbi:MAG: hypothetical protein HFI13_01865 [Lachnospiraceae bacterium]|jgi:hypothetical protein|nr:hypothetical protein [Lachnospiraceae bacterium]